MNDAQVRLGCLELGFQLLKPSGNYCADDVVKIAIQLYTFTQASAGPQTPLSADKPSKAGKKGVVTHPDILT
jgi:hypothetical protein